MKKKIITRQKKLKKTKKMPCYQGKGLGCPVALLAGFPSKLQVPYDAELKQVITLEVQ